MAFTGKYNEYIHPKKDKAQVNKNNLNDDSLLEWMFHNTFVSINRKNEVCTK